MLRDNLFLRRVLLADAAASGGCGLLMLFGATQVSAFTALPTTLLTAAGAICLAFAVFVAVVARRPALSRAAVWFVVGVNVLYVLECVGLLLSGWISPNAFGTAFILMQAVVVGVLAELQIVGLRRSARAALA